MANTQTTQIVMFDGTAPLLHVPVAGSQTLVVGDFVYLASGLATKSAAPSATINTDQLPYGVVQGASTLATAGKFIKVVPLFPFVYLALPTYGATPALTQLCIATGNPIYNDAGVYKVDVSSTTKPIVKPIQYFYEDFVSKLDPTKQKSSYTVGDRYLCSMIVSQCFS